MSGLCGWLLPSGPFDEPHETLRRMAAALPAASDDGSAAWAEGPAALCLQGHRRETSFCRTESAAAAVLGYPLWSHDELAARASQHGHASALLEGHRRFGAGVLDHLFGTFTIALVDGAERIALLAIDRMGAGRMCYAPLDGGGIVFATSADSVRGHPAVDDALSRQGLYNYLFYYMSPAPGTVFRNQRKLRAGERLIADGTKVRSEAYWQPRYQADEHATAPELADALLARLEAAHKRAIADERPETAGAFLSGGLDSSTVAGFLSRLADDRFKTFTIGFDVEGFDETSYANIAAEWFATDQHTYFVTADDVVAVVPRIVEDFDEPFGNTSAIPVYYCARLAKENGIDLLYAGDGGDEIFAGNERYLEPAAPLAAFARLPRLVRTAAGTTAGLLPPKLPLAARAQRFVDKASRPLPDRLFSHVVVDSLPNDAVFEPEFLAAVDVEAPIRIARAAYHRAGSDDEVQCMMSMDHQLTLADNDLRKVTRMCDAAGVRVRFPMLDDDLVAFAATVPPDVLLKPDALRSFYKNALSGTLPPAVIAKQKQGFGLPSRVWMTKHRPLQELCEGALDRFAERGILRRSFLDLGKDALRNGGRSGLIGFCWDIMILELWMSARGLTT